MKDAEHESHPAHQHQGHGDGDHESHPVHQGHSDAARGAAGSERPAGGDGLGGTVALESDSGRHMAEAATSFLAFLTPEQRRQTVYPVDDPERFDWHYIPKQRQGLPLKEMDSAQQKLAHALLSTGLSGRGYVKAVTIMGLESVLAQLEGPSRRHPRDPDLYHVTIFGTPSDTAPWGWRVEGHHVSVNVLVVGGNRIAPTPSFLGANPARVPDGLGPAGLRVLAAEEDLARRLLTTLDEPLRRRAVIAAEAPSDILTRAEQRVKPDTPAGIRAGDMSPAGRHLLMDLIEEYVRRMPRDVADTRLDRIEKDGTAHIHFAWAGPAAPGEPHYYRLQGPAFLVEYDNTQNNANHIHSVWRDFTGDWGDDLLSDHYQASH